MTDGASALVCGGCGAQPDPAEPYPFRCRRAGHDDVDHVIRRVLDPTRVRFPDGAITDREPFVRYRTMLHSYHRATAGGLSDAAFVDLVSQLDRSVAEVEGVGFAPTPFQRSTVVSEGLGFSQRGGVWIKDETGNVAGSHKGRHLMGLLVYLTVVERLGLAEPAHRPGLVIASCGNAALAAAVVARGGGWRLRVLVPVDAAPAVVSRLHQLEADVVVCPRDPAVPGDPTYVRLRRELAMGSLPFTCQGTENGLAIEGGETLGYEIVSDLRVSGEALDHLVVQVGGGALASACAQAFEEAEQFGVLNRLPRLHAVQTAGAHPLERAYRRLRARLPAGAGGPDVEAAVRHAARHRSAYMWPWESEPKSVASGILDDETYDWLAVVRAMLLTGGEVVVVDEDALGDAHDLGRQAGYPVDPTGSSGLAGVKSLLTAGVINPDERVAVLFTGVER